MGMATDIDAGVWGDVHVPGFTILYYQLTNNSKADMMADAQLY